METIKDSLLGSDVYLYLISFSIVWGPIAYFFLSKIKWATRQLYAMNSWVEDCRAYPEFDTSIYEKEIYLLQPGDYFLEDNPTKTLSPNKEGSGNFSVYSINRIDVAGLEQVHVKATCICHISAGDKSLFYIVEEGWKMLPPEKKGLGEKRYVIEKIEDVKQRGPKEFSTSKYTKVSYLWSLEEIKNALTKQSALSKLAVQTLPEGVENVRNC